MVAWLVGAVMIDRRRARAAASLADRSDRRT
jgi:hypothetical protein